MPTARLRVYLDVDGTILYQPPEDGPEHLEYQDICAGVEPLLRFVIEHCEPSAKRGQKPLIRDSLDSIRAISLNLSLDRIKTLSNRILVPQYSLSRIRWARR